MSISRWFCALAVLGFGCGQPPVIIDGGTAGSGSEVDSGVTVPKPVVLLLIDTSGSMSLRAGCSCMLGSCASCLPSCEAGQKTRWHDVLGAVSGSISNYSCEALERTVDNGCTYDVGYFRPFYKLGADAVQQPDGLLDRYQDRVRFGLATFDSMRTYTGASDLVASFDVALSNSAEGQFSYAGGFMRPDGTVAGELFYPTVSAEHFIDTGIVSALATEGALILPSAAAPPGVNDVAAIKEQLLRVRTFGGTPTASALDDLYFAFDQERSALGPKSYVVLLTDGFPDDDFREYPNPGCDCAARGNCPANEDPARMRCPYPTAPAAAYALRCGYAPGSCNGPVKRTDVVTFALTDSDSRLANESIATQGGGRAYHAADATELASALDSVLSGILADAARD